MQIQPTSSCIPSPSVSEELKKDVEDINREWFEREKIDNPDYEELQKNYLLSNPDWQRFVGKISDDTVVGIADTWQENFDANFDRIVRGASASFYNRVAI